jgi:hypothetical protein
VQDNPADAEEETVEMTGEQLHDRLMANFGEMAELEVILRSDTYHVPVGLLESDGDKALFDWFADLE